jgi:hypothetical protein
MLILWANQTLISPLDFQPYPVAIKPRIIDSAKMLVVRSMNELSDSAYAFIKCRYNVFLFIYLLGYNGLLFD